jgi:hypothetical protein
MWCIFFNLSVSAQITSVVGSYEDRKHFIISTKTATYFLDSLSGGLSRMIDPEGKDWIAYKNQPWGVVPGAAGSSFRGVPNLVYQGDDGGVGHPGWDKCATTRVNDSTYGVRDRSGKWSFAWHFTEVHARLELISVDTSRSYWFLYEGPVAGRFSPRHQYWATDVDGLRHDRPNIFDRKTIVSGHWRWVYFGDESTSCVLFVLQESVDTYEDFLAYMGNSEKQLDADDGMMVFGFGRSDKPLLRKADNNFYIGFMDNRVRDHDEIARRITSITP